MADRVLFIDDEKNVLSAFQRMLHDDYDVCVAHSADEAISQIDAKRPFSAVVCDMRMPNVDGIETLKRFARKSSDTVRIMLSGNADQETAIRAINEGHVFRYLNKPCPEDLLRSTLKAAVKQYDIVLAEKTLLEKTLLGSVRALMDVMSVSQPEAYSRAARARKWVRPMVKSLNDRNIGDNALSSQRNVWEIQLCAVLWPIGLISVPPEIVARAESAPESLSKVEQEMLARAPETANRLLAHIPRMENVAAMILYQDRGFDGTGFPSDGPVGVGLPEGARILKFLKDLAAAGTSEMPTPEMVAALKERASAYDPALLATAHLLWGKAQNDDGAPRRAQYSLSVNALMAGDHLLVDIVAENGKLLLLAGNQINTAQLERLRNLTRLQKVKEPILIERET